MFHPRKAWAKIAAAFGIGTVVTMAVAPSAFAVDPGLVGYAAFATNLGTFRPSIYGEQVVCIDSGRAIPTSVTAPFADSSRPDIAYIMSVYGQQTASDDIGAAVGYLVKKAYDSTPAEADAAMAEFSATKRAGINAQITALTADAAANAGPYDAFSLHLTTTGAVPTTGAVEGVGVQSASGNWLSGYPITVTLSGPAVFDATGTNVWTGTTGSPAASLPWHVTGTGTVKVEQVITGLPGTSVWIHPSQATGYQRVLASGDRTTVSYNDPVGVAGVNQYVSAVTTQTSSILVETGDSLHDIINVTTAPNAPFTGTSTLYGPFATMPAAGATAPAGAPVVGTATFSGTTDANGAATVSTTNLTVGLAGFYVWQETLSDVVVGGTVLAPAVTGPFGAATETSLNYTPKIQTKISTTKAVVGAVLTDTAIVSGIQTSIGGKPIVHQITGILSGPVTPVTAADGSQTCVGANWNAAPTAATIAATPVTANGEVTGLGKFTVEIPGCYSYGEVLSWSVTGGAATDNGEAIHPVSLLSQTALVTGPAMSTTANFAVAGVGATLTDKIVVTGTNGAGGVIYPTLYGPMAPVDRTCDTITDQMWRDAITAVTVTGVDAAELPVSGDGTYETSGIVVDKAGCYTWYEEADFDNGTATPTTVVTPLGVKTETTLVLAPVITTVAAQSAVTEGSTFTDTITLSGTYGAPGTITGSIYGPMPSADGTCAGIDWSAAPVFAKIDPIATTGDGVYLTNPVTTKGVGCYTFAETWTSADNATIVHNTGRGEVSETMFFAKGAGGTGIIDTGIIGDADVPAGLVVLGGLLLLIGLGGVARARQSA